MLLKYIFISLIYDYSVHSRETFNYEKENMFGLGRRIINLRFSGPEFPEPLPSSKPESFVRSPYRNLYQGTRTPNDTRVYSKKLHYEANPSGHRVLCEAMFDCIITHIAIETNHNIPIMLRGGVGYWYFSVVIRAAPGEELSARARAFCVKPPLE